MKILLNLILLLMFGALLAADPLPSWNEGAAKKSIIDFVTDVTTEGSKSFVTPNDRIAAFDNDGTLWVEQPVYPEFFFAIDSVQKFASKHPEWADKEPYQSIIKGEVEAVKHFSRTEIVELIAATHAGMTLDEFQRQVADWLKTAVHPKFKKPFTDLTYKPMLEAMEFLRENKFVVYIVSGGGQDFMRVFAEKVYGVPPSHVIGTCCKMRYEYRNGHPVLLKLPEVLFIDDKAGKPEGINLIIGKRPIIAFGNSVGDREMLEWTQSNAGKTLELLVHHDDQVREYAYGPASKIGTFSDALMIEAKQKSWIVISMKDDWKTIFNVR